MLYNNKYGNKSKALDELCLEEFNRYNNLNYFIHRKKKYNPNGRNQTEQQSDEIAQELLQILKDNEIEFKEVDGIVENVENIVNDIIKILKFQQYY